MADEVEFQLRVPKKAIKKLGKVIDLDSINLDTYQLRLLSSTTGLTLDNLDTFDSTLVALECNPSYYTRTTVPLQLTEITTGYQIEVSGASVVVPISSATIQGIVLIKLDTLDIVAAALNTESITLASDYTFLFETPIWVIGQAVCTA